MEKSSNKSKLSELFKKCNWTTSRIRGASVWCKGLKFTIDGWEAEELPNGSCYAVAVGTDGGKYPASKILKQGNNLNLPQDLMEACRSLEGKTLEVTDCQPRQAVDRKNFTSYTTYDVKFKLVE